MLTGIKTRAGWRVRVGRVRVRDHPNFPVANPHPPSQVAGLMEPAAHAELLVLYSLSLLISSIYKVIFFQNTVSGSPFSMPPDLPPKGFAHMLLNAGDRKLLRNRRMPRILHWQGKHSRVQSFGTDQSQLSSKEREKVK